MNLNIKNTLTIIGIIIGLILIVYLNTIVAYVLVSVVLALIGRPIMKGLSLLKIKGKSLPMTIKSTITLVALVLFFFSLFSLFTPLIIDEARILSTIDFESVSSELQGPINDLDVWLKDHHLLSPESSVESEIIKLISLAKVKSIFNSALGILGNSLIALFSILFITFFFLKEKDLFNNFILNIVPTTKSEQLSNALKNAKRLLSRYFIGVMLQVFVITIIVSLGLSVLGIENAILIGFLAGLINVVPYVGPIIGASIGIIIGISTNLELDFYTQMIPLIVKICVVFGSMQLIDNFILQPIIFSNSVKAHPLEIFLIVISAGTIWGITGMIIAIPFYTFFRVIAKEFLNEFKIIQELTKNI
ncbi:AI-2E family transporter [bacterium]|mgnify:CR=1 FL=1|nr:AI-2E family transporter [bacterium]MDB2675275.1 AI-2E family transporter [Flavobacteriales bacterium]